MGTLWLAFKQKMGEMSFSVSCFDLLYSIICTLLAQHGDVHDFERTDAKEVGRSTAQMTVSLKLQQWAIHDV